MLEQFFPFSHNQHLFFEIGFYITKKVTQLEEDEDKALNHTQIYCQKEEMKMKKNVNKNTTIVKRRKN